MFRAKKANRRGPTVTLGSSWPDEVPTGSRVVVECRDADVSDAAAEILTAAGHEVRTCPGPDDRHRCPLLETGSCALVDGADVVVNLLGFRDDDRNAVLDRLQATAPGTPVVVEASPAERARHHDELDHAFVLDSPLRRTGLLTQVTVAEVSRQLQ
jgi:hypothetical protein